MQYIFEKVPLPTEIRGGAIFIWNDAFPQWKEVIAAAEKESSDPDSGVSFDVAKTADGDWKGKRRNRVLWLTTLAQQGNEPLKRINNQVMITFQNYLNHYAHYFETSFTEHEPYSLLKYSGSSNDHYDAHYDGGPSTGRWISAIIYLNDDYEGGEIEFPDHLTKVKPKAGTLMIFPSNYAYRHIAHNVTSGTKYAIVTWINGF